MSLKFKAKIINIGNSYGVTIPKAYIENKLVSLDKILEFEILTEEKENAE